MAGLFKYKVPKADLKDAERIRGMREGGGPKLDVKPVKTAAAVKKLESLPGEMKKTAGQHRRRMKKSHPETYKKVMKKKGEKRMAKKKVVKKISKFATHGTEMDVPGPNKPISKSFITEKTPTKAEFKAKKSKGRAAAKNVKVTRTTPRGSFESAQRVAGKAQETGAARVTRPIHQDAIAGGGARRVTGTTAAETTTGRRVGAVKKIREAAAAQQAGRPVTKPTPLRQITAQAGQAPAPRRTGAVLKHKPAMGRLAARAAKSLGRAGAAIAKATPEIMKYKPMKTFHTAGAVKGAGVRAAAWQGTKRVAPGVAAGVALGTAIGGKKGATTGAVLGGAVAAVLPRVASRAALPLAAGMGAVDIGRAGVQAYKGVKAAKHVKTHARAATKAGYRVTRKHPVIGMITGDPGIKITKAKKKK